MVHIVCICGVCIHYHFAYLCKPAHMLGNEYTQKYSKYKRLPPHQTLKYYSKHNESIIKTYITRNANIFTHTRITYSEFLSIKTTTQNILMHTHTHNTFVIRKYMYVRFRI